MKISPVNVKLNSFNKINKQQNTQVNFGRNYVQQFDIPLELAITAVADCQVIGARPQKDALGYLCRYMVGDKFLIEMRKILDGLQVPVEQQLDIIAGAILPACRNKITTACPQLEHVSDARKLPQTLGILEATENLQFSDLTAVVRNAGYKGSLVKISRLSEEELYQLKISVLRDMVNNLQLPFAK